MTLTRFRITVEYRGTRYAGWQIQGQGERTIQGCLEDAIFGFSQQRVTVTGAGRTDSGVHARGQCAHFDFDNTRHNMDGYAIAKAINAFLRDENIAVLRADPVNEDFHARFSAKNKLYTYSILNRPAKPAIDTELVWHIGKTLDTDAMLEGAQHLIGTHDFTSFRAAMCQAKSPIKHIDEIRVERAGDYIFIHVFGPSFLHHMVRNIAGTLVLVGEGKWQPIDVKHALEARARAQAGITAPPQGLSLIYVGYDGDAAHM